jgi:hypothetical protein
VVRLFVVVGGGGWVVLVLVGWGVVVVVWVLVGVREFDAGEDVSRFGVDHFVGELDELAVLDDFTHAESASAQKMDAAKTLTSPSS